MSEEKPYKRLSDEDFNKEFSKQVESVKKIFDNYKKKTEEKK